MTDIAESFLNRKNHIDWNSLKRSQNAFGRTLKGYSKDSRYEVTIGLTATNGPITAVFAHTRKAKPTIEEAYPLTDGEIQWFYRRVPFLPKFSLPDPEIDAFNPSKLHESPLKDRLIDDKSIILKLFE